MPASDYQIVQSDTFQGGLVTLQPAHLLSDGATPSCQNVDFSTSLGCLTKRKGYSILYDSRSATTNAAVTGLHEYITAAGVTSIFASATPAVYLVASTGNWIAYYSSGTQVTPTTVTATIGQPLKITKAGHGLITGNTIFWYGVTYSVALATVPQIGTVGLSATITFVDANNFTVDGYLAGSNASSGVGLGQYTLATGASYGNTNFTTFNNLCIAVGQYLTTAKSTGGLFTSLLGSPPSNGRYIESHKGRVFIANTSAGASRLHFCYLNNPEDWTTIAGVSTDAGYIDVGLDDGETITGIKTIGSVLLVFKQTSTWALFGSNPTDFKVRKISPNIGCVAPRSIVACDTFAIFLSNQGIYSANSEGCTMLSYNIKPTVDAWTSTQRATACAGRLLTQYWIAIDTNADTVNDSVYYLDYVYGVWGLYTNKKDNVYYTRRDGTLISGAGDTDNIRTQNDTDNDNGSAITMIWDTPDYDFEDWTRIKHPTDIVVVAYPISGKTIVVSHLIDGVAQGTTLTFTLTASGSQTKVYLTGRGLPNTSYSRYIRFRFTNSETSAPVQIFAYSIRAFLDQRQNG